MPKVSIVVPVYNVEKYLDRCVQSLLNQTLKDIEIILVDDGSPDNCPRLCDVYADNYTNIKVVHKKNGGLGLACNSGIEVATGDFIAFCDSDDWVDADMYQTLYNSAIKYGAEVVYSGLKRVDGTGNVLGYLQHPTNLEIFTADEIKSLALDMIASTPDAISDRRIQVSAKTALYKLELLKLNNIRFVSERNYPSEDLIFNITVLTAVRKVVILPDFFYNYFINLESISTTVKPLHYKKMIESAQLINSIVENSSLFLKQDLSRELYLRIGRLLLGEARSQSFRIAKSSLPHKNKSKLLSELRTDILSLDSIHNYPISHLPKKYALIHKMIISKYNYFLISIISKFH